MAYILSCCSTADLSREHFESRDIHYICFHFFLDGKAYPDDLGESIPFDKFYAAMANGADTRTSQINTDEFIAYFTPFLEEGKDILHVSLSSGISGVSTSATELRKTKPVISSFGEYAASGGYWISAQTDKIISDANTLTGSIGVFSLSFNVGKGLKKHLHINSESIGTHAHSAMGRMIDPYSDKEAE